MNRPALHLAPMADVTDAPMRAMSRRGGADVCTTEMVSAEGLVRGSLRTRTLMARLPEEGPLVVQLYGGAPGGMAAAAELAEAHGGFVGIDVNAEGFAPTRGNLIKAIMERAAAAEAG